MFLDWSITSENPVFAVEHSIPSISNPVYIKSHQYKIPFLQSSNPCAEIRILLDITLCNLPVMKVAACASYIPIIAIFQLEFNLCENWENNCSSKRDNFFFDAFSALECSIWLKSLGKRYRLFYWNIILALDMSRHMTKYLFFQWLDCIHIEIGSIWLSLWRYQLRICQSAKHSDHKQLKSLSCCRISRRSTSTSNWYSAIGPVAGVLCAPGILWRVHW